MADADETESRRLRRWRLAALLGLVVALVTSPITMLGLAFWAASDSWEFDGGGLRHWLFVKGTSVDRLGLVDATDRPVRYVVRLAEGTDPGAITATFDSRAMPDGIVSTYAERCHTLKLEIVKRVVSTDAKEASLVCAAGSAQYNSDDVWIVAERTAGALSTQVRIMAGPGLTGVYNF